MYFYQRTQETFMAVRLRDACESGMMEGIQSLYSLLSNGFVVSVIPVHQTVTTYYGDGRIHQRQAHQQIRDNETKPEMSSLAWNECGSLLC